MEKVGKKAKLASMNFSNPFSDILNPAGLFVLKNNGETNYYIVVDHSSLSSGIRINGKIVHIIAIGYLPKNGPPALSLRYSLNVNFNDQIKWKPEMGLQLDIVF